MNINRDNKSAAAGMWRTLLALAVIVAVALASSVSGISANAGSADEAFLQRLAGSWKGRGKMRPNSTAKLEPVSCRMSATWNGGSKSLRLSMNCRGVDVNFSSSGVLKTQGRNNVVLGSWSGALGLGGANISGRRSGNALSLTMTTQDRKTGKPIRNSVYLRLSGNGQRLSNSVNSQDGKTGRTFRFLTLSMRR